MTREEFVEKYWLLKGDSEDGVSFEVYDDVGMVEIETLEQHDAEIEAPLNYHLKQALEFGKSSYTSLQEQLELVKQGLVPAPLPEGEYALHYLSSDRIRKQAKQEVINELLAFIKENQYCVGDYSIENHYYIATDKLKQKLNEMKGVLYERKYER